jgi:L-asparaginase
VLPDAEAGFFQAPDDLSHLKLIDAAAVQALADEVNGLKAEELKGRKVVILLATGGTLAMTTYGGIRRPTFVWHDMLKMAGHGLERNFELRGMNAFSLDSSQMSYAHVCELAIAMCYLWKNIKIPHAGFLVTHGTDTMSYGAAAMSLIMGQGLPFSIVYTGSQRPPEEAMSDAGTNIRRALYTLDALHEHDMAEVLIVMGERAMLATSAEKVDDRAANAFDAPRLFYIANFSTLDYPIKLAHWLRPRRKQDFKPTVWQGDWSHSLVIKSSLGLDPKMLDNQINLPLVRAVILYSYGAGTIHEAVLNVIATTAKVRKIPVFIVNPFDSDYQVLYESAAKAVGLGIIPLNMTLSSALAKAEIAIRLYPDDIVALSRFMMTNYVGEVPTENSRYQTGT